jgi:hypothetical protein
LRKLKTFLHLFFCIFALPFAPDASAEDDNFFSDWEKRASATQTKQPGWAIPVFAPYTNLVQAFRWDATRPSSSSAGTTWNYGGGKGFNLIPWYNMQADINVPSYFLRNKKSDEDGFGDLSFGVRYRIASGNEKHGNYSVLANFVGSIPTGSFKNGNSDPVVTPSIGAGKGFGRFDVQSTVAIGLPLGNTRQIGRHIHWNTVAQYHLGKHFWPEIESNTTFFRGGINDGKVQHFILPGIIAGKFKLKPEDPMSRLGVTFGVGMQFATSEFHSYDHMPILSARFVF